MVKIESSRLSIKPVIKKGVNSFISRDFGSDVYGQRLAFDSVLAGFSILAGPVLGPDVMLGAVGVLTAEIIRNWKLLNQAQEREGIKPTFKQEEIRMDNSQHPIK